MVVLHHPKKGPTSNYDSREKVEAFLNAHPVEPISFDGVYASVWENRDLLVGRDVTLFVVGAHVGGNNAWDEGQPLEQFCTWWQLLDLHINYGCEIGWHTWNHPDLTNTGEEVVNREVQPPFPMRRFAYPYGKFDELLIEKVKAAGFEEAYCLGSGDDSAYQRLRRHI